jgi:hypothetical protein
MSFPSNFFHFLYCVDIAERQILDRETMIDKLRRERQEGNPMPKRGLGRMNDGKGTSQIGAS